LKEILAANPLETIDNADIDSIKNAKDELMKVVTEFSTKMYQAAGNTNQGSTSGNSEGNTNNSDSDTIDADYKEV